MNVIKCVVVLTLIVLGACTKPAIETKPSAVNPAGQNISSPNATAPVKSAFVVTRLRVEPETVEPLHPALIIVTVNNTGKTPGTYTVAVKVDGNAYTSALVTLPGGLSQNLTFPITPQQERNMLITVDELVCELKVVES